MVKAVSGSRILITAACSERSRNHRSIKHTDDFRNDPEWKKVAAESEANGKIVSKVESVFMDPADFSPMK